MRFSYSINSGRPDGEEPSLLAMGPIILGTFPRWCSKWFLTATFVYAFAMVSLSFGSEFLQIPYEWNTSQSVPQPPGGEVLIVIESNEALIALTLHAGQVDDSVSIQYFDHKNDQAWQMLDDSDQPDYFMSSFHGSESGLYFIGAKTTEDSGKQVNRIVYDPVVRKIVITQLSPLPEARFQAGIVIHKNRLYVAGGIDDNPQSETKRNLWTLDLAEGPDHPKWESLPSIPENGVASPLLVLQNYGDGDALYLFDSATDRFLEYNLLKQEWRTKRAPPRPLGTSAIAVGTAHIFATSRADEKIATQKMSEFLAYHTITDTWVNTSGFELPGKLLALWAESDSIVMTLLDDAGTIHISRGTLPEISTHFHILNYGILASYFAILIFIGHWFSKQGKTTNDYFRGGRRVAGWAAGISIIGTKFSTVSFLSIPAKSFASDWTFLAVQIIIPVGAIIVIRYFLGFFYKLDVTTAFEYLEKRFNLLIRLIGSLNFVIFEVFRMGILVLLPSIVLSVITGIDIYACILIIGVVSTIYTILGGIEAVIWTDVLQVVIMVGGAVFAIAYALVNVEPGAIGAISHAVDSGKTQIFDFDLTLTTVTVWVVILHLPSATNNYVSNQTIVQRYISTKNLKQAEQSLWVTASVGPAIMILFFILGTAIYLFYQSNPTQLNPTMQQPDEVLAWFIVRELPVGLSGLMVGAIFAATMSSLDSSLNGISTVFVTDIYRRFKSDSTDAKALRLAKILTAILGVVATGSAFLLIALEAKSLFDRIMEIMGLLYGGLAGLFILGMLTRRTHSQGILIGYLISIAVLTYVKVYTDLQFFLFGSIGVVVCGVVGYLASLLFPVRQKSLDGLTIHTTTRE
jgi:SSS family transporter